MKTFSIISVMIGLVMVSTAQADFGRYARHDDITYGRQMNDVDARQYRQQMRIGHGIDRGMLTRRELRKLDAQQRKIAKLERRFSRDGYLNRWERRVLQNKLDHASSTIRSFKHNDYENRGYPRSMRYGQGNNIARYYR